MYDVNKLDEIVQVLAGISYRLLEEGIVDCVDLRSRKYVEFVDWLDDNNGVVDRDKILSRLNHSAGNLVYALVDEIEAGDSVDIENFYRSATAPQRQTWEGGNYPDLDALHMVAHFLNEVGEYKVISDELNRKLEMCEKDSFKGKDVSPFIDRLGKLSEKPKGESKDMAINTTLWDSIEANFQDKAVQSKFAKITDRDKVVQIVQEISEENADAKVAADDLIARTAKVFCTKGLTKQDADLVRGVFYIIKKDPTLYSKLEDCILEIKGKLGDSEEESVSEESETGASEESDGYGDISDFDDTFEDSFFETGGSLTEAEDIPAETPKESTDIESDSEDDFGEDLNADESSDESSVEDEDLFSDLDELDDLDFGSDTDEIEDEHVKVVEPVVEKPKPSPAKISPEKVEVKKPQKSFDSDVDQVRNILANAASDPEKLAAILKQASQTLEEASKDPELAKVIAKNAQGITDPKRFEAADSPEGSEVESTGPKDWDDSLFGEAKTVEIQSPRSKGGKEIKGFIGHRNHNKPMLEIVLPAKQSISRPINKTPMTAMAVENRLKDILKDAKYKLFRISSKEFSIDQCHFDTRDEMVHFVSRVMYGFLKSDVIVDINKKDEYILINYRLDNTPLANALRVESL